MLLRLLQSGRTALANDLATSELRWKFSPELYLQRRDLVPILERYVQGSVLDVGCGTMPFREYLNEAVVEKYEGFDVEMRSPETKFVGDAQQMVDIPNDAYDRVVSFFAMEHMPRPWAAFAEMVRVCKPGGTIILALPHISRLHEEPHDYFRFTHHGVHAMAEQHGLEVLETFKHGGIFTFLGHQFSTILVCLAWRIPVLKWVVFWANYLLVVRCSVIMDALTGASEKIPVNIVAVISVPER